MNLTLNAVLPGLLVGECSRAWSSSTHPGLSAQGMLSTVSEKRRSLFLSPRPRCPSGIGLVVGSLSTFPM